MRKTLRYLRIAWSIACGIACLVFVALWLRSYWFGDMIRYDGKTECIAIISVLGRLQYAQFDNPFGNKDGNLRISSEEVPWDSLSRRFFERIVLNRAYGLTINTPTWLWVLLAATCATLPWLRWRFSLRTLLIAMTLLAIVLGAFVISMR